MLGLPRNTAQRPAQLTQRGLLSTPSGMGGSPLAAGSIPAGFPALSNNPLQQQAQQAQLAMMIRALMSGRGGTL